MRRSGGMATTAIAVALAVIVTAAAAASPGRVSVARGGSWTFEGKADLHDSGALELEVHQIGGVPRGQDIVRRLLIGRDVLLVGRRTVVDRSGRPVALARIDKAILRVRGTLLPPTQWRYDLDGEATPTVRVTRVVLLSFAPPD